MERIAIDDPTFEDIETKHRSILKDAVDRLSNKFKKDTWDLTVYLKGTVQYDAFGKYIFMYWDNPYTIKISVAKDDAYTFEICDSTWDTTVLTRRVEFDDFCIGEVDFFINSIEEFFAIKNKLRKFTNNYNDNALPMRYKRNDKLEQLLS